MKIKPIQSAEELGTSLSKTGRSYLLLYKSGSEKSDCAFENLQETITEDEDFSVLAADVITVGDIHPLYQIKTVPTLLEFDKGEFRNVYKGCHQPEVLKALFEEAVYYAQMAKEGKTAKQVTVYSTPACSWCTTLKSYLNKNKIRYTDVDISRDPNASQTLVARTGQQGVPQTEVNGQWVVGFDQKRLNELLEIK
ncbi:MAG: glutaredoxin family protein [Bacteroidota bacterium]|nr:glutaredoxin family protein [Bacteroidota bacterium]